MQVIKVFQLVNTPAAKDYFNKGWSVLVIRDNIPQLLIYLPQTEDKTLEEVLDIVDFSQIRIQQEAMDSNTEVFLGMAVDGNFYAQRDLLLSSEFYNDRG